MVKQMGIIGWLCLCLLKLVTFRFLGAVNPNLAGAFGSSLPASHQRLVLRWIRRGRANPLHPFDGILHFHRILLWPTVEKNFQKHVKTAFNRPPLDICDTGFENTTPEW